ncbi:MAG: OmpA family protein [Candidatus Hatepunaea meridiana]|nr:OmpA family protein [Candidatus Hatepunaea meridiana]
MMKSDLLVVSILVVFLSSITVQAGPIENNLEIGFSGGAVMGLMESETGDFGPAGFIFMQTPFSKHFRADFGLGMGELSDSSYTTNIVSFRERFLYYPLLNSRISPYVNFGIGGVYYTIKDMPPNNNVSLEEKNFAPFATTGIGVSFQAKRSLSFDLSGGYNYSFTNDLNAIGDKYNDSYIEVLAGIKFVIDMKSKEPAIVQKIKEPVIEPVNVDIDSDGLTNTKEKSIGTDENNPDTDGDGLSDGKEVNTHKTDPLKADSDSDGLLDKEELENYKTNPLKADSDDDGLSDSEEIIKYKTNPLIVDTDGGSVDDFKEVERGSDPLNKDDDIIKEEVYEIAKDKKVTLEGIVFNSGSAKIIPTSMKTLEKTLSTLKAFSKIKIEIQGYSDNTGKYDKNVVLSQKRADSVRDWLINKGIDACRLTAKGFGPENPVTSNETQDGRKKNRRIEFIRVD